MSSMLQKLKLEFNPFDPSAAGPPLKGGLTPPRAIADQTRQLLSAHQTGCGAKAVVITGDYGTGKTCLLSWLHQRVLPSRRIKSFYFDNPGVQFYDLANALLRTIGRKDFAKFIWELAGPFVSIPSQPDLFQSGFEAFLSAQSSRSRRQDLREVTGALQEAILLTDITSDEQIADCLARIATDAVRKPYFEYRDFVPRQQGSLVAEAEEAPYFGTILKTIAKGVNAEAIAFLIDEFEETGLQKRLTRKAAHDYLATLKRLINLSQSAENEFWVFLSMTPDLYLTTVKMDPALEGRFSGRVLSIEPLDKHEAETLIKSRIEAARCADVDGQKIGLFPFPDEVRFRPVTYSNPRRLVKTCFYAIADATDRTPLPFSDAYLESIEEKYYPTRTSAEAHRND